MESALALVHQRFSTYLPVLGTGPTVPLPLPQRRDQHPARQHQLDAGSSPQHEVGPFGVDLEKLWPLIGDGASDSATFDNALELLLSGGYSLPHAMMLMVPEAWADNPLMDPQRRAFTNTTPP